MTKQESHDFRRGSINYRYRLAQQRNWEIEIYQWFRLFMEFLWKLQDEKS